MKNQEENSPNASSLHLQELTSLQPYLVRSHYKPNQDSQLNNDPNFDYGLFNLYKLDDLVNLQSDGFDQNTVIRLAFVEHNSIHLEEDALALWERYVKNQIGFVGVYGKSGAGKSLMLDKILNLCEFQGANFSKVKQRQKGLYIWSVPLSKANLKLFFIDIDGYDNNQIDNGYLMLLDFLLLLSSTFVVVCEPKDYGFNQMAVINKHLKKAKNHFQSKFESQQIAYWPKQMYCLFRDGSEPNRGLQSLRKQFNQFNFSVIHDAMDQKYNLQFKSEQLKEVSMRKYAPKKKMLNEEYIKRISSLVRDIHSKIQCKQIQNLRFTGANLPKVALNAIQSLNMKNYINLDKIFHKSMKELYIDAYNFHTQLYNEQLSSYLQDEKPFEVDYLLTAFRESSRVVLRSFSQLTVNQELKLQYGEKLEKYISQKEKMILAINKKKSSNRVKGIVPSLKEQPQLQEINIFLKKVKKTPKNLEQVYVDEVVPPIVSGFKKVAQQRLKFEQSGGKVKQKTQQFESKLHQKQSELMQLKKQKQRKSVLINEKKKTKQLYDSKQKDLNKAIIKLKAQLSSVKINNLGNIPPIGQSIPLNKGKSSEQLKKEEQRLKEEIKQKDRALIELKSSPQLPKSQKEIKLLQTKIQQKMLKQKELQSVLASNIPKLSSVQAIRNLNTNSVASPRKVQSRVFRSQSPNIRIIPSPKA